MFRSGIFLIAVFFFLSLIACNRTARVKNNLVDGKSGFIIEAWADNWFAFYLGDELILEDSVSINTERSFNAERKAFSGDFPLQLNFILKDYIADDTGLEYLRTRRQQIGDGGFAMQILDRKTGAIVAVSNELMKCMVIHRAPLDEACADSSNPIPGEGACKFEKRDAPDNWMKADFFDSGWANAKSYSINEVRPKDGYDSIQWNSSTKLIWSNDLKKDNTLLCRLTLDKPMFNGGEIKMDPQLELLK